MNNLTKLILKRKSIRHFTETDISELQVKTILKAGMAAPTAKNAQPWHFVLIEDKKVMAHMATQLPYAKMLTTATLAIVVCGDTLVHTGESAPNWVIDCAAATQNMLLVIESMDLGAVWTGCYPYAERIEVVRQALHLPEHIVPLNVIPIGGAQGNEKPLDKWKPERVHVEKW